MCAAPRGKDDRSEASTATAVKAPVVEEARPPPRPPPATRDAAVATAARSGREGVATVPEEGVRVAGDILGAAALADAGAAGCTVAAVAVAGGTTAVGSTRRPKRRPRSAITCVTFLHGHMRRTSALYAVHDDGAVPALEAGHAVSW